MKSFIPWVISCPECSSVLCEAPKGSGQLACISCGFMTHYLDDDFQHRIILGKEAYERMKQIPTCKCGLKMKVMPPTGKGFSFWFCECGNGYDAVLDEWCF